MKQCFAYVRVSTPKQKEKGVSPDEQKDAIKRYAQRHEIKIIEWFEEVQTAAKSGRREFTKMLRLLGQRKVEGVVIHKIDRSARNLRDWIDLGDLIDAGVAVYFANENIDLRTRGGRLSADIQAVVAADFIRNLREETRKGFYGRLKQGLYPLGAPLGYLDRGKGMPKAIDPAKAPLVQAAFELYATGRYNFEDLVEELYRRGLRNRNGKRVSKNGLSTIFNNSFYYGIIRLKKTGETFQGVHPALISVALYNRVQAILRGKTNTKTIGHDHTFRRLLTCGYCGKRLRSEVQKGHVYYRCHTRKCHTKCVREEVVEEAVKDVLHRIALSEEEKIYISQRLAQRLGSHAEQWEEQRRAWQVQIGQVQVRLDRLINAYLDGTLEKELFEARKAALLLEQRELQEKLSAEKSDLATHEERVREVVELAGMAWLSYEMQSTQEKRELIELTTSNRIVRGKNVCIEPSYPFALLANRQAVTSGDHQQDMCRSMGSMPGETQIPVLTGDLQQDMCRSDRPLPERHGLQALGHVIEEIYSWLLRNPQALGNRTRDLVTH